MKTMLTWDEHGYCPNCGESLGDEEFDFEEGPNEYECCSCKTQLIVNKHSTIKYMVHTK